MMKVPGFLPSGSPARGRRSDLLPWDKARQKAEHALTDPRLNEFYALVQGTHYAIRTGSPEPGYYMGNIASIPRLGVPPLKMQDAGQGFRVTALGAVGTTTSFPCALALASTWDEGLVVRMAAAVAREFRGKGANVMLGPALNVHRVARNGRNHEYLSGEDPYLGARLAAAYVRAVQGEGVMATAKHFAFSQQETNRTELSVSVDDHTAWNLYYPPFEAAVRAGLGAIMCANGKVGGTFACESSDLLEKDLRGRMGFQGMVMSDWGATRSTEALLHGLQVEMPGVVSYQGERYGYFQNDRLDNISLQVVRGAAERVLTSIYHLRLDEQRGCDPPCLVALHSDQRSAKHRRLALVVATRAVTLLKNDGVLPLDPVSVRTVAVVGSAADAAQRLYLHADYYTGGGSSKVFAKSVVTPLEGIKKRAKEAGVKVLASANNDVSKALKLAQNADVVIAVVATTSSEGADRTSLSLDDDADALITAVAATRPTVVLMQTPGAVLTPWRHRASAIANLFLGGEETGSAWAAVLFGDFSPSGKLPIMMPASEADAIGPSFHGRADYAEGLFTSYRSPTFQAAFPFGHGLSYGRFGYGIAEQENKCAVAACVRLRVTNWGRHAASEVVQAYLRYPMDASQPQQVLKGFYKTKDLRMGAAEEVRLRFTERDLSVYRDGIWLRAGHVQVAIGASSHDIKEVLTLKLWPSKATLRNLVHH